MKMAEVTASMVKDLRELTGLGMMECKRALEESGGDMKKAEELLRIKSGAKASKAASRVASEGTVGTYLSPDSKLGAMVEVNCETDFVARNPDFAAFSKALAELVATANPADVAALTALRIGGKTVEETRQALVQKIGENITVRRFERVQSAARLAQYVHGVKIGVIVEFEGQDAVGKDVAMHIAFAKPRSSRPATGRGAGRERTIIEARRVGKPAEIEAKLVEGGLNKYLGEITLQASRREGRPPTVEKNCRRRRKSSPTASLRRGEHRASSPKGRRGGGDDPVARLRAHRQRGRAPRPNPRPTSATPPMTSRYNRICALPGGPRATPYGPTQSSATCAGEGVASSRAGGVVNGGDNIFRGVSQGAGMDRATADYKGMHATVKHALALPDPMTRAVLVARVQSALNIEPVCEPYTAASDPLPRGGQGHLRAGTGNPLLPTDKPPRPQGRE